jgi:TonB family protein
MPQTQRNSFWNYAGEGPPAGGGRRDFKIVPRHEELCFQSLEFVESRRNAVFTSIAFHIGLLAVLLILPLFSVDPLNIRRYYPVYLVPPEPKKEVLEVTHWKPVALPKPKPEPIVAPPPEKPVLTKIEEKRPDPPKIKAEEFKPPVVKVEPKPALLPTAKAEMDRPQPPKEIKTGGFGSTGSSATPTVNLPAKEVQTGGFGDPNGIKGEGKPGTKPNIASLGSFDLPTGPGAGNGTGGAKGAKGVVASAGFGNGTATDHPGSGNGGGGHRGSVQQGGFGDVDTGAVASTATHKRETEAPQTSVEITFKPRPDYTEEARKLKIEGEVLVRVLFTADGHVKVLGVSRGLGHGLDENALHAAEQIKFKPAAREGTPVDSTATVHIVFQLAY